MIPRGEVYWRRYMTDASNSRNRSYFDNGTIRVLLFSGRFEFFRRMRIYNAQTIYFVSPPSYPNLWVLVEENEVCSYSDFVNNMKNGEKEGKELSVGVTVLYTKFDTYVVEEERREVRNRWNEWWEHQGTRRCSSEREICFYFVKLDWEVCLFYSKGCTGKSGDHEK